jgi:hypothetical protein
MSIRYFTVEEANALLPELEPLVGRLLELRASISLKGREVKGILPGKQHNGGSAEASRLAAEFAEIEALIEQIRSTGCVIKSLEAGLLDFLCERDGRDVYLCWRYGEPSIQYYHELHTGFQGRRPL